MAVVEIIAEQGTSDICWLDGNYDPTFDLSVLKHPGSLPEFEIERIANKILRSGKVSVDELKKICDNIVKGGGDKMERDQIENEQKDVNTLMGNAEHPGNHGVTPGVARSTRSIDGEIYSLEGYYSRVLSNSSQQEL